MFRPLLTLRLKTGLQTTLKFGAFYLIAACFLIGSVCAQAASNTVTAARVWPAQEYTRIAFESTSAMKYQLIILKNPDRLVLDIEDIDLNSALKTLSDKILSGDPYIKQVRVAKYKPNVVRIAVDLKGEVKSNLFALAPAGEYKNRLVLDIYPLQDELMSLLDKKINKPDPNTDMNQPVLKPVIEPLPPIAPDETAEPKITAKPIENKNETVKNEALKNEAIKNEALKKETPTQNKEGDRLITIAIDAGHGGEDPGARGASGSHEKDITLKIAKKLKDKIDAESNMRGVLTRDGDYFVPLHGRVVKARNAKADLFVSIHADAFTNQAARGSSVFALSEKGATSASARYLAKKENESDLIGGVSLDDKDPVLARTLLDLSQAATINDSLKLGKAVLGHIGEINKLHTSRVEQAAFAVLKSPDIPSILVETAFISNPEEEKKLNDEAYQDKLVDSIFSGIKKYFSSNPALAKTKVAKD
ncbi:MAG: N-acetylmuramoyl-L-alanine amidase [Bdellovibrio sp.]|nr:N-acetylmuramoyl-L-alanine amidase [Methylotenera sp.]